MTCIIYYEIDPDILNNYLEFYSEKENTFVCKECIRTGLIISFDDKPHNASMYYTNSDKLVNRYFVTIFIVK